MRKILSLLGAVILSITATINMVACGGSNQKLSLIRKQTDFLGEVLSLTSDKDGNVYAGTEDGEIYKKSYTENTFKELIHLDSLGEVLSLTSDKDGNVYAGTGNGTEESGEIYKKSYTENTFKHLQKWKNGAVKSLTSDKDGNVYAGTMTLKDNSQIYKILSDDTFEEITGTMGEEVLSLTSDKDGNVYAGTEDGEIYKKAYTENTFKKLLKIQQKEEKWGAIFSLTSDKDGNIYAGRGTLEEEGKVYKLTDRSIISGTNGDIFSLTTNTDGNVYAGTATKFEKGKVYKKVPNENKFIEIKGINGNIIALTSDKDGNVYAGTGNGSTIGTIFEIKHENKNKYTKFNNLSNKVLSNKSFISNGNQNKDLIMSDTSNTGKNKYMYYFIYHHIYLSSWVLGKMQSGVGPVISGISGALIVAFPPNALAISIVAGILAAQWYVWNIPGYDKGKGVGINIIGLFPTIITAVWSQ